MAMTSEWFDLPSTKELPLPHRVYAWWSRNGPKRRTGGVYGGNRLFSLVRAFYRLWPSIDGFATIPAWNERFTITIDLLDFEVPHHTLPLSTGTNDESGLLQSLFPPGGIFFDVGANHGFYSLMASHIGGPNSVVCAFEPQPRLAEAMRLSKEMNQFTQLRICELVLSDEDGQGDFFIPDTGSGVGSLLRDHAGQTRPVRQTTVNIATLDSVFKKENLHRLDVIKIDVEGAELEVLRGARETLERLHPFVWFEMNPAAQRMAGHDQEDIYSLLEMLGYEEFLDVADYVRGTRRPIRSVETLTNVLAVPGTAKHTSFFIAKEETGSL